MAVAAASPQNEDKAQSDKASHIRSQIPERREPLVHKRTTCRCPLALPKDERDAPDMKPVFDAAEKMNLSPNEIVSRLSARMSEDNPAGPSAGPNVSQADQIGNAEASQLAEALKAWEETNAVSAPPGYAQIVQNGLEMQQEAMKLVASKIANMSGAAQQVAAASAEAQAANMANSNAAVQQRIANNLNMMQQQLGLADDDAAAFEQHMIRNGLTVEDMANMDLVCNRQKLFKREKSA